MLGYNKFNTRCKPRIVVGRRNPLLVPTSDDLSNLILEFSNCPNFYFIYDKCRSSKIMSNYFSVPLTRSEYFQHINFSNYLFQNIELKSKYTSLNDLDYL